MSEAQIGLLGDGHLGALERIIPGDSVGLQLRVLAAALRTFARRGIRYVVQAGDLFDTPAVPLRTVLRLADLLARPGCPHLIVIPGNHDRPLLRRHSLELLTWLARRRFLPVTVILEPRIVTFGSTPVWLCPHPFVEDQPDAAAYSIGHFAWTGARRENGSRTTEGATPAGRWYLGDYHTPQRGPRHEYAGSITQIDFDEAPAKRSLILTGREPHVEHVPLPQTYRLRQAQINNPRDLLALPQKPGLYYRLLIDPNARLPDGWQAQYPNVRRTAPLVSEAQAAATETLASGQLNLGDAFDGLPAWLTANTTLPEVQRRWADAHLRRMTEGWKV